MAQSDRIKTIDVLRGVASFGVAWFHLTHGNPGFLDNGWVKRSGTYGWAGVEIFFVISGFIIPYSLYKSKYQFEDFGRFTLKRIIRLDPPYLVNIVVVLGLGWLSSKLPGFRGHPFNVSAYQTLLHLGYLNAFVGQPWINPVYWTLAIEFQFYLLVGILFRHISGQGKNNGLIVLIIFAGLSCIIDFSGIIFPFVFLFGMGILTFRYKANLLNRNMFLCSLTILCLFSYFKSGFVITLVGVMTSIIIAFVEIENKWLASLGLVSYSLYLIHPPIGGKIINLGERLQLSFGGQVVFLLLGLLVCLFAATLFYFAVEKPAQKWASSIHLGSFSGSRNKEEVALSGIVEYKSQK